MSTPFKMKGSPLAKKKVTVESTQGGTKTKKTITRTRKDGTVKRTKVIISGGETYKKKKSGKVKVIKKKSRVIAQKYDKSGKAKIETVKAVDVPGAKDYTRTKAKIRVRKYRKSDTKA